MSRYGQYNDSVSLINDTKEQFTDSQEAAFRRLTRQAIRRGDFTRGQRDVMLAFVNFWFHHRAKGNGTVYPGRKKLAARAKVSIRTVASVLDLMREAGAIVAIAHLHGKNGKATEYRVDPVSLFAMCGVQFPTASVIGVQNCTGVGRAKIAHQLNNVVTFPFQKLEG